MLKDLKRIEIFAIFAILVVYFFSRIISLNNFPIFTDEAIYLRWAQIAKNDANWRFISLTDGKQPLFIWLTMVAMKLINDPITAGRFVSVLTGAGTIIGLVILGKILFRRWNVGIIAGALYAISPFALVYDRLALMDGLLACLMIWALLFEVLLSKTLRLDVALVLGGIIGFAMLTKTSGFIALYLLPISLILFDFRKKERLVRLAKWVILILIVAAVSLLMYSVLRLSPFFHIIAQKDKTFLYSYSEWFIHPLADFLGNLKGLVDWTITYLTWPLVISVIAGLLWGKNFIKERIMIFSWFIIPLLGLALFGRVIYPRFILFMTVPLFILCSYALVKVGSLLKSNWQMVLLFAIFMLIPLRIDFDLLFNPSEAKIPFADSHQYFNDWPSGWGIKESIKFFQEKAQKGKITVFTEGTFGLLPAALELYLADNKNISVKGLWPVPEEPTTEVLEQLENQQTYIIFFQNQPPHKWSLEKILEIKKGKAERYHTVYQVKPKL